MCARTILTKVFCLTTGRCWVADGKYETIGHMTCGAFSLAKGCGAGLGLVRAHELARRVHVQCSADDEHYRLAMLGVVMPR